MVSSSQDFSPRKGAGLLLPLGVIRMEPAFLGLLEASRSQLKDIHSIGDVLACDLIYRMLSRNKKILTFSTVAGADYVPTSVIPETDEPLTS